MRVAVALNQDIDGRDQSINVHVYSFYWKNLNKTAAKDDFHLEGILFLVLLQFWHGVSKVLHCLHNVHCLSMAEKLLLHLFRIARDFSNCRRSHIDHRVTMAEGKPIQKRQNLQECFRLQHFLDNGLSHNASLKLQTSNGVANDENAVAGGTLICLIKC